ncbi:MAG: hypothetical protein H7Y03_11335 [Chitinophagaceae bacterium]|nr:hypothetical protein [Chitinophagaceae bacterium]
MRLILLVIFYGLFFLQLKAQQFGGNPPSLRWKQINTPSARVIFPSGLDTTAGEVAAIIGYLKRNGPYSLGMEEQKVSIVLQNQGIISNGYVGLGPFRSEFYLTPLQNSFRLGSLPWHKQLALHEFRHVQQYNNFNVGLSRAFRILFGQEGQALANGMAVPNWFFEGDAVFNETQTSGQGRGRLPFFHNGYRSLWIAGKDYSWMKLRNGSLKDYTPDHYQLGYLLVAYGYEKYGSEFWKNVTRDAASFKGLFYPLQKAVKRHSGVTYRTFREEGMKYFRDQLDTTTAKGNIFETTQTVTDEEFPAYVNDTTIVYLRSSYKQIPAFTLRSGSSERRLRVKDISVDEQFSYRNKKIVYAAFRPDARWGWKNYGVINVLDLETGKQRTITSRTRYFAPDINEQGSEIVTVEVDIRGKSTLHLLNAKDGKIIRELANPESLFYTYPKFYTSTQVVSAVRNQQGEMSLALTDLESGATGYLLPFSYSVIGFPAIQHDTVFFTASAAGNDKLFAVDIKTKALSLISTPGRAERTGSYQPAVINNRLTYSVFTAAGFRLRTQELSTSMKPVSSEALTAASIFKISALNKGMGNLIVQSNDTGYSIRNYSKSFRLVNFHSLEPYVNDPDYQLSLLGENVLNTLQTELFFSYNRNEQYKQIGLASTYGALFPYITFGGNYTIDRRATFQASNGSRYRVFFNQAQAYAGLQVPLNLSRGRRSNNLSFGTQYVFSNPEYRGFFKDSIGNRSYTYLNSFINLSSQIQVARQQIFPRFAQTLSLNYRNTLTRFSGNQFQASANLYFPGLSFTHNLVFNLGFSARDNNQQVNFSNSFPFARGYYSDNFYRMYKAGANYHFPLLYPDAGIGNIVYLLRVRANGFYDFTRVRDFVNRRLVTADFRSTGCEVFFDTSWWNEFRVNFGIRYSRLLDNDPDGRGANWFEFILPVNLFSR